jgi:hypothetical protein
MTWTPRRILLTTVAVWLLGTCAWGAIHIRAILTEDPRVLWGEPYVYTLSFQLFAFVIFWLPRSLLFILFPILLAEVAGFKILRWKRERG